MSKKNILIVEDEGIIAENIRHILEIRGYNPVGIANSGESAVEMALAMNPDLILMDIILKGEMDGVAAVNEIRSNVNIPVVYLTAYSDEKTIERVKSTGPFGYVLKPINQNELYSTIEIALTRHEMELKLLASEAKNRQLATAIEQAAEDIILTDLEGKIQYVNPAFERVTGYASKEVIGKNPKILKSGKHDRFFYEGLWKTIKSGGTWSGRIINRKKDGSHVIQDATISPIRDIDESTVGYVSVKRDVTRQVEIESQLVQAQKMEAVGTLASGLAHDFNNVLGGIIGSISLLELILSEEDHLKNYEKINEYMKTARESSSRAADMITQVLSLSRKQDFKPVPVDVNISLKHVMKICQNSFPKSIKLQFHLNEQPVYVSADPGQIEQVILNLCLNASHAITSMEDRENGALLVKTEQVDSDETFCKMHADAEKDIKYARIVVSDNGTGMNDEVKKRVFEPFFTTKDKGKGTGLGMAMVYNIVKQHRGFIDILSEVNIGTTVSIYIPMLERRGVEELRIARDDIVFGKAGCILVVDDEETIRYIVDEMLRNWGFTVITAGGGEEAIDIYRENSDEIIVVLLDMSMPEMSGLKVYEKLKEIDPEVRVLLMSGFSQDERVKKAIDSGARGFLQKPFSISQLGNAVKHVID